MLYNNIFPYRKMCIKDIKKIYNKLKNVWYNWALLNFKNDIINDSFEGFLDYYNIRII